METHPQWRYVKIFSKFHRISLLLVILVAVLLINQSSIFAETDNSLEQAQTEIENKQNQISELKDQERALLSDLVALESQLQQNKEELDALQKSLRKTQSDLHKIQIAFRNKQEDLREKRNILKARLENIYIESRFINLDFILSCKDITTLLSRLNYLNLIAKQDAKLVQKVESQKQYLELAEIKMEQENRNLMELESSCKIKQAELDKKVSEKRDLLNKVKEEQLESEGSLRELQDKAIQIRIKMNKLQPPSRGTKRGTFRMLATGYCPCSKCCGSNTGTTATGLPAGKGVVAVDPRIIPLGTKLYISEYGEAIAGDTGRNIVGERIDLGFNSHTEATAWGKGWVVVDVLE
jgi:3D (Asp-Asp-Asp) domain-containing protein